MEFAGDHCPASRECDWRTGTPGPLETPIGRPGMVGTQDPHPLSCLDRHQATCPGAVTAMPPMPFPSPPVSRHHLRRIPRYTEGNALAVTTVATHLSATTNSTTEAENHRPMQIIMELAVASCTTGLTALAAFTSDAMTVWRYPGPGAALTGCAPISSPQGASGTITEPWTISIPQLCALDERSFDRDLPGGVSEQTTDSSHRGRAASHP